jgi:hypothetical protein
MGEPGMEALRDTAQLEVNSDTAGGIQVSQDQLLAGVLDFRTAEEWRRFVEDYDLSSDMQENFLLS